MNYEYSLFFSSCICPDLFHKIGDEYDINIAAALYKQTLANFQAKSVELKTVNANVRIRLF